MRRKIAVVLLVIALVLAVAPAAFAQANSKETNKAQLKKYAEAQKKQKKSPLQFEDWEDAPWAQSFISRMRAMNVVRGYEDGSFKPNSSVSQTEALVMVIRMKGVATEQAAVALAGTATGIAGSGDVWWANGHIAYALQQGWIDRDDFKPSSVAKRGWVARLMVRALVSDWQTQIQAHAHDLLPFKDLAKFNAADVPFIALAVSNGWMLGYPDGEFKPDRPVTRAEMAALLDRGQGLQPGSSSLQAQGIISAIDTTQRKVTLVKGSTVQVITVSVDALIFLKNSTLPGSMASLLVGDEIKAVLNGSGVALVITVETNKNNIAGTVAAINLATNPRTVGLTIGQTVYGVPATVITYNLSYDCKLVYQGIETSLVYLAVGDTVNAVAYQNVIEKMTITSKAYGTTAGSTTTTGPTTTTGSLTGTLRAIASNESGTTLTIRDGNGVDFAYQLSASAVMRSGGVTITLAQLSTGGTVTVVVANGVISTLDVLTSGSSTTSSVTVTSVNLVASPRTIRVVLADAVTTATYSLSGDCKAYYQSAEASLTSIGIADKVQLTRAGDLVTSISITEKALASTTVRGTIQTIETGTSVTITVRDGNGVNYRYPISSTASLTSGGVAITAGQLATGLTVSVTITNSQIVTLQVVAP